MSKPLETLLTLPEAARKAKASRRFLEKEIKAGRIIATRLGGRCVRIGEMDLQAWFDSKRITGKI